MKNSGADSIQAGLLGELRNRRNFKPDCYVTAKCIVINDYFKKHPSKFAWICGHGIFGKVSMELMKMAATVENSSVPKFDLSENRSECISEIIIDSLTCDELVTETNTDCLHMLSDLHVSEVFSLATYINIENLSTNKLSASVELTEFYIHVNSLRNENDRKLYLNRLDNKIRLQYHDLEKKIVTNAEITSAKDISLNYKLDVMEGVLPLAQNNLSENNHLESLSKSQPLNAFVLLPSNELDDALKALSSPAILKKSTTRGNVYQIADLLSPVEIKRIWKAVNVNGWKAVSVSGSNESLSNKVTKIGSFRSSVVSCDLAELIWKRISPHFGGIHFFDENSLVEYEGINAWRAVGISPFIRFVKYTGECDGLTPHYDESILFPNGTKAMMRVLVYLNTDHLSGGHTVFVKDPDAHKEFYKMQLKPWDRLPKEEEILFEVAPIAGQALIFDHKCLHGARPVYGEGEKVTFRTDILFVKCLSNENKNN